MTGKSANVQSTVKIHKGFSNLTDPKYGLILIECVACHHKEFNGNIADCVYVEIIPLPNI